MSPDIPQDSQQPREMRIGCARRHHDLYFVATNFSFGATDGCVLQLCMAIALPRSRRKSPSRAPHDGSAQNLQHGTLETSPASRASSVALTTGRTSDGVALGAQLGRRRLRPAYNPGPYAQRWTRPALAHWVRSATCFPHWCNGRICAQRFIPHWSNGRSRAQWEKNLTCLAFISILFRFSALPSTAGTTYHQTLARCDPSTSPALHTVKNCQRPEC